MYECPECHKQLRSKRTFESHVSNNICRKRCHICSFCNKNFTRKESLQYHLERQVCRKLKPKIVLKNVYAELSRDQLINKLVQTESELTYVKGEYNSLKENPQHIINNIVIYPKAFGKEDIGYIQQKLGDIFKQLIKDPTLQYIPNLFVQIHNNEQLPEYHNVYTTSEHSSYALVSDGKKFKYCPKKTVIDQIIEDKRSLLNQYVDDNDGQLGKKVLDKYERYENQIDENSDFRKQLELELEIGGLLLDMKSVIANDEKTRKLLDKVDKGNFGLPTDETPISPI